MSIYNFTSGMPQTKIFHIHHVINVILHVLRIVFGCTTLGLYAPDLATFTRQNLTANPSSVYAEVVATLSIISCSVQCYVIAKRGVSRRWVWCIQEGVMAILWTALFGNFASVYFGGADAVVVPMAGTMKTAMWIDLTNMLLWYACLVWDLACYCVAPRSSERSTRQLMGNESNQKDLERGVSFQANDTMIFKEALSDWTNADSAEDLKLDAVSRPPSYRQSVDSCLSVPSVTSNAAVVGEGRGGNEKDEKWSSAGGQSL